jgi:hypothetical protein
MSPEVKPEKSAGIDYKVAINKEFIPLIFILASPVLSFMNGYGIKTLSIGIDLYYIAPLIFGLLIARREKIKIVNPDLLILLALLNILMTMPFFGVQEFIKKDLWRVFASYGIIILFFTFAAGSFFANDPYYAAYFRTKQDSYRIMYHITGVFFVGVALFHATLFYKVYEILMLTN